MNDLSWLIYLADVAGELGWIFSWLFGLSVIGGGITALIGLPLAEQNAEKATWKMWGRIMYSLVTVFFVTALLNAFVPSRETVYAIAASEMGEEVLNSETGGKAVSALNAWLDDQIDGDEAEEEGEEE